MIEFRCWYCDKHYTVPEGRIGERITCTCKNLLRVPRRSGGNCQVKTPVDWLVETVVYGGGGALLGLGLALVILSRWGGPLAWDVWGLGWILVPGLSLIGFLAGLLGGERGINWVGRMIRSHESR
jgi:hypothetical protein